MCPQDLSATRNCRHPFGEGRTNSSKLGAGPSMIETPPTARLTCGSESSTSRKAASRAVKCSIVPLSALAHPGNQSQKSSTSGAKRKLHRRRTSHIVSKMMANLNYIRFFEEFGIEDVPLVGGKNASLGEMFQKLSEQGIRIPHGFATTAAAYRHMLDSAGAWDALHAELDDLDPDDVTALARKGKRCREIVYGAGLPDDLAAEIVSAYRMLQEEYGEDVSLAVRSSATAEDLPTASFAGQQETFLNITGSESLLDACRRCFASLFTDRAIHYRVDQGFDHFKVSLSIGVMKMVRSDLASSGVMFTIDTESGFNDVVFITGAYGLGENVVQGAVDPDEFYVHKPTYLAGHRAVLRRLIGDKAVKMVFVEGGTKQTTRNIPTPKADRAQFCITDEDVLELAGYACTIERHYGRPMDIEWAKDGLDGQLYIVQARPKRWLPSAA